MYFKIVSSTRLPIKSSEFMKDPQWRNVFSELNVLGVRINAGPFLSPLERRAILTEFTRIRSNAFELELRSEIQLSDDIFTAFNLKVAKLFLDFKNRIENTPKNKSFLDEISIKDFSIYRTGIAESIADFSEGITWFSAHISVSDPLEFSIFVKSKFSYFKAIYDCMDDRLFTPSDQATDEGKLLFRESFRKFKDLVSKLPLDKIPVRYQRIFQEIKLFEFGTFWNMQTEKQAAVPPAIKTPSRERTIQATSVRARQKEYVLSLETRGFSPIASQKPLISQKPPKSSPSDSAYASKRSSPKQESVLPQVFNRPANLQGTPDSRRSGGISVFRPMTLSVAPPIEFVSVIQPSKYLIPETIEDKYEYKKVFDMSGKILLGEGVFKKAEGLRKEELVYGWDEKHPKFSKKGHSMSLFQSPEFGRVLCPPNFDEACRYLYRIANGKNKFECKKGKIYDLDRNKSFDAKTLLKESAIVVVKSTFSLEEKCKMLNEKEDQRLQRFSLDTESRKSLLNPESAC